MEREVIRPYYTTEKEDQIECVIKQGNKNLRSVINKFGADGETVNPDWEWVHKVAEDEIKKNTQDFRDELKSQKEREEATRKRILGEELFNLKLEIFEMDEVRKSKNTKMKSKIRRAENKTQALLYASALIQQEIDKPEEPVVEKKAPVKKKAPAKKRVPRKKKPALSEGRVVNETTGKVTIVDTINDDKRDK